MTAKVVDRIAEQLRRVVLQQEEADQTDGALLTCFIERRDEAAFEVLVRRHGPMVSGVCRRVLRHQQDAEDAFQATFLVLVRKATSIVPRAMVANWLYGVAHQTAIRARSLHAKRREREQQAEALPEVGVVAPDPQDDLHALIDEELSRLPDKYRVPIVLCELEGKTRKEAAQQLNWPEGSVAGRLVRARALLAKRLARRGVTRVAGSLGLLSVNAASACIPAVPAISLIKAAGPISAGVAALTEGVIQAMWLTKLKGMGTLLSIGLILSATGVGVGLSQQASPAVEATASQEQKPAVKAAETTPQTKKSAKVEEASKPAAEEKKPVTNEAIQAILKERVAILKEMKLQLQKAFEMGTLPLQEVRHADLRLLKAQLDLCETDKERIAVHEAIVKVLKEIEATIRQQLKAGVTDQATFQESRLNVLDAMLALERLKAQVANPPSPVK